MSGAHDPADELSRTWPCPKCGCSLFYTTVVFERGYEAEDGTFHHFYPPAAVPMEVDFDDVRCAQCRLHFSITDAYALGDAPEFIDLREDECDEDCDCLDREDDE